MMNDNCSKSARSGIHRSLALFSLGLALVVLTGCRTTSPSASAASDHTPIAEVTALLNEQAARWNQGDLVGFMEAYLPSDEIRFSSGATSRRGWVTTLERYKNQYPNKEAMGQLSFEDMEVFVITPEWTEAFGRYRLKRGGNYADATGLFTLLLKRTEHGWRILHDHTSSGD